MRSIDGKIASENLNASFTKRNNQILGICEKLIQIPIKMFQIALQCSKINCSKSSGFTLDYPSEMLGLCLSAIVCLSATIFNALSVYFESDLQLYLIGFQ